jgi:hypothetical protein
MMTRPILIGFLHDLPGGEPKIFFRAMLYASGKRGHIIESLFLRVRRGESAQIFNVWMHGETNSLKIGSGLRVGEEGISCNHHFLPPPADSSYRFMEGEYVIEVIAHVVGTRSPRVLARVSVTLLSEHESVLHDVTAGVLFNWGPDSQRYIASRYGAPPVIRSTLHNDSRK